MKYTNKMVKMKHLITHKVILNGYMLPSFFYKFKTYVMKSFLTQIINTSFEIGSVLDLKDNFPMSAQSHIACECICAACNVYVG